MVEGASAAARYTDSIAGKNILNRLFEGENRFSGTLHRFYEDEKTVLRFLKSYFYSNLSDNRFSGGENQFNT